MKNLNWPIKVFFITFLLAAIFSGATNLVADLNICALSMVLIFVIFIGSFVVALFLRTLYFVYKNRQVPAGHLPVD